MFQRVVPFLAFVIVVVNVFAQTVSPAGSDRGVAGMATRGISTPDVEGQGIESAHAGGMRLRARVNTAVRRMVSNPTRSITIPIGSKSVNVSAPTDSAATKLTRTVNYLDGQASIGSAARHAVGLATPRTAVLSSRTHSMAAAYLECRISPVDLNREVASNIKIDARCVKCRASGQLAIGTHNISAAYREDFNSDRSPRSSGFLVNGRAAVANAKSSSADPSELGTSVTLIASIGPGALARFSPAGAAAHMDFPTMAAAALVEQSSYLSLYEDAFVKADPMSVPQIWRPAAAKSPS